MNDLGQKIRLLRKKQKRSLQDIADDCGFTRSLLSKIETGKTSPPVATLTKIAKSLGTSVAGLLDETAQTGTVFTLASQLKPDTFTKTKAGYSFYTFAQGLPDKMMQPFVFTAKRGEVKKTVLSHEGEEFVYVLKGEMKYRVGSVEYHLKPGDSLYFDSQEEHSMTPVSASVTFLALFAEPQG